MPRRATLRKKVGVEFTEGHKQQLLTGHSYLHDYGSDLTQEVLEVMRRDWSAHRKELLKEWITGETKDYLGPGPGTRPWAWWFFEAPGMRRCWEIETDESFCHEKRGKRIDLNAAWEELPAALKTKGKENYFGMLAIVPGLCEYESQEEFLRRHKLLTVEEWKILERD